MKATGIVRRIDDLGRVVVPKEIRRTLRIHEGDPLEIFTDKEGEIILKKYSPMGELGNFVNDLCDAISKTTKRTVAVCDRDIIIAASGSTKKDILEVHISQEIKRVMEERIRFEGKDKIRKLPVCEDGSQEAALAYPIITQGDVTGCVIFIEEDGLPKVGEAESKLAETVSHFLSGQLEG